MSPHLLAWRHVLQRRMRSIVAVLVIGAGVAALDLTAGHVGAARARLEYQAVVGERLGHLDIFPKGAAGAMFTPAQVALVTRVATAGGAVLLVMPQMQVSGIASNGKASTVFHGEGLAGADKAHAAGLQLGEPNGIVLSNGHAQLLGVQAGSKLTLNAIAPNTAGAPLKARVVDIFDASPMGPDARSVLMPLDMAQALRGTGQVERIVVFLADPARQEASRTALAAALARAGIGAEIRRWQDLSEHYKEARRLSDFMFACVAAVVASVLAAAVAATAAMNAQDRRREVATLRALGMRAHAVFLSFALEGVWLTVIGIALGGGASGLAAWVMNRTGLSNGQVAHPAVMVELDIDKIAIAVAAMLLLALLAASPSALKAARAGVAESLSG
jgi:putative ABC transport system permease protein